MPRFDGLGPGLTGRFELGLTSMLNGFELSQPRSPDAKSKPQPGTTLLLTNRAGPGSALP